MFGKLCKEVGLRSQLCLFLCPSVVDIERVEIWSAQKVKRGLGTLQILVQDLNWSVSDAVLFWRNP